MNTLIHDRPILDKLLECILDSPAGKRSISRLARTCRSLCDPALSVLWRELDNIIPIVSLFPAHLLKRAKRPGMGFATGTLPTQSDWEQVLQYGKRVQKISFDEASSAVAASILPVLEETRPVPYFLPSLLSLTWRATTGEGLTRALPFVSPSLQRLSLDTSAKITTEFLQKLCGQVQLASLSLTSTSVLPETGLKVLSSQTSLQEVAMIVPNALTSEMGKWMATCPLQSLQLDLSSRAESAVTTFFNAQGSRSRIGFQQLKSLYLIGEIPIITAFLARLRAPLQQLILTLDDAEDEVGWRALLLGLHNRFGSSLRGIAVNATRTSLYNNLVRNTGRGRTAMQRRLHLQHFDKLAITHLDIDLPESTLISDADVAQLAKTCSSLESLRLCPTAQYTQGPPSLTLGGLASLTRRCRRLHTLHVVVDALPASATILADRECSSRSLINLHVGHSWLTDALHTAILLSHLAPHLDFLRWFHEKNRPGYVEKNALGWQTVAAYLPHLQAMRLLERSETGWFSVENLEPERAMVDQAVDASIQTIFVDKGVSARPTVSSVSIQAMPTNQDAGIDAPVEPDPPSYVDQGVGISVPMISLAVGTESNAPTQSLDGESADSEGTLVTATMEKPNSSEWVVQSLPLFFIAQIFNVWSLTTTDVGRVYYPGKFPAHLFGAL